MHSNYHEMTMTSKNKKRLLGGILVAIVTVGTILIIFGLTIRNDVPSTPNKAAPKSTPSGSGQGTSQVYGKRDDEEAIPITLDSASTVDHPNEHQPAGGLKVYVKNGEEEAVPITLNSEDTVGHLYKAAFAKGMQDLINFSESESRPCKTRLYLMLKHFF